MASVSARHGSARALAIRYSHSAFAALLLVFMFIGFRHFYLAGNSAITGGPIESGLAIYAVPHGISNTAWMLVLLLQPLLIANRQQKLHKTLAWWLLGIAVLVPITGALVAINGPRITPNGPLVHGITYRDFVLVMLSEMAVFAVLVATAVLNRKRPHVHRSLMMLSGLAILSAATDRTDSIMALTGGLGWWGMFGPELTLGLAFFAVRWVLTGKPDRWFAGGLAVMMAIYFVAFQLSTSAAWNSALASVFGL